jgi:hypothetical protein
LILALGSAGAEEAKRKPATGKTAPKTKKSSGWYVPDMDSDQSGMRTKKTPRKK